MLSDVIESEFVSVVDNVWSTEKVFVADRSGVPDNVSATFVVYAESVMV